MEKRDAFVLSGTAILPPPYTAVSRIVFEFMFRVIKRLGGVCQGKIYKER